MLGNFHKPLILYSYYKIAVKYLHQHNIKCCFIFQVIILHIMMIKSDIIIGALYLFNNYVSINSRLIS